MSCCLLKLGYGYLGVVTPFSILLKNTKNKKKNLKTAIEKVQTTYKGTKIRITVDFLLATKKARK